MIIMIQDSKINVAYKIIRKMQNVRSKMIQSEKINVWKKKLRSKYKGCTKRINQEELQNKKNIT